MPPQAEADALGEKVMDVIARTQKLPREKVTLDSTFEQLNIDSLDGINIVFELEKEFGIDIPDDGVAKLRNVGDTVQGVRELLEKKHQPVTSEPA
jgi:acyl carrier protein